MNNVGDASFHAEASGKEVVPKMGPGKVSISHHQIAGYVGMPISLWLFLFAAQPKEFFLDGLKKLEQRSHKCVELRG
jgi:hypothetical protein